MRRVILSVSVWLALGAAAVAQGTAPAYPPPANPPGAAMPPQTSMPPGGSMPAGSAESGTMAGTGRSEPMSTRAANINQQDQAYQKIAPNLPNPPVGENASPVAYLHAAQSALAAGRTGEAQQSLEMAQTRLLDRSVPYGQTNTPIRNPAIEHDYQGAAGAGRRGSQPVHAVDPGGDSTGPGIGALAGTALRDCRSERCGAVRHGCTPS